MSIALARIRICAVLLVMMIGSAGAAGWAASFDVILCGKGGEEVYEKRFADWGTRLKDVLVNGMGHPQDHVYLLTEPEEKPAQAGAGRERLDDIRKTLEEAAAHVTPQDVFFIYLIGHGSYQNKVCKFIIGGPDLSAEELNRLLGNIHARTIVVVNAASGSAGFINILSGENRIICTSTKSVDESNTTEFMGFFIQGLEDKSADLNHDERISILEACQQSAALTQADYAEKGLILTEHALIDDNGDRLGTRLAAGGREDSRQTPALAAADAQDPRDGNRASACYLKDYAFPVSVPREWVDSYLASLDAVEQLKRQKAKMDGKEYYAQLEKLLIKAATINRDIRSKIKS